MQPFSFIKVQGMGNDFLIVEVPSVDSMKGAGEIALSSCDRKYGAGADGVVFVAPPRNDREDFSSRIFNADGSEAGVSGNGTRCTAAFLYYRGRWSASEIRIGTSAGVKSGRLISRNANHYEFEFDMGRPGFSSSSVPMSLTPTLERVVRHPLRIGGDIIEATCLSMGNPQCIIFVSELEVIRLDDIGPLIEHHPVFPDRANVEFVKIISREEIQIRIWERGAGHTLSSGTGSCASAVAAAINGLTERRVRVLTEGGALAVDWHDDDSVLLTASADVIYEGNWLNNE